MISDTEDDSENHAQSKQRNGKRILKNDNSIGDLWDDIEHSNIPITGIPKEESEREAEKCLKKWWLNVFLKQGKETDTQVQKTVSNKMNPKRLTTRNTKMARDKDKKTILKAAIKKQEVTWKGTKCLLANSSSNFTGEKGPVGNILSTEKKESTTYNATPARLSFRTEGLPNHPARSLHRGHFFKRKQEFATTRPALQKMLKGLLYAETSITRNKKTRKKKSHY